MSQKAEPSQARRGRRYLPIRPIRLLMSTVVDFRGLRYSRSSGPHRAKHRSVEGGPVQGAGAAIAAELLIPRSWKGSTMARIVRLTVFVVLLLGLLALPGGRSAGARDAARLGRLRERARVRHG
jgi:hypothetical protein